MVVHPMSCTITIIGSLNYDLVTYTSRLPEAGETFQADSFETHFGGKGFNQAIAAGTLLPTAHTEDREVRMVGRVGTDAFGSQMKHFLLERGVQIKHVTNVPDANTGVAVILVEGNGENRILITPGANGELNLDEKDYQDLFFEPSPSSESSFKSHYVILQNEQPDPLKSINWLHANRPSVNIAYNPSPYKEYNCSNPQVLGMIDILVVNEGEALSCAGSLLSAKEVADFDLGIKADEVLGLKMLAVALATLINTEKNNIVVITIGSRGSVCGSLNFEPFFAPALKVENVVDTTGAGDTFLGGFVSQLASGKGVDEAVKFATAAAALAVQKKGAAEAIPSYEQVMELLK